MNEENKSRPKPAAMSDRGSRFEINPEAFAKASRIHESEAAANEALAKFGAVVQAARLEHGVSTYVLTTLVLVQTGDRVVPAVGQGWAGDVAQIAPLAALGYQAASADTPHDSVLACPRCGQLHVDAGDAIDAWHRDHMCVAGPDGSGCDHVWSTEHLTRGVLPQMWTGR